MTLLETLTTACTTSAMKFDDEEETTILGMLYTGTSSTVTSSVGNPNVNVSIQATNDYIDSLSVEQLAEFDEMLA